jgi:hypothetical protein
MTPNEKRALRKKQGDVNAAMAVLERHPRFAAAQYRAITESSELTANLTEDERREGTPARLHAVLRLLDIRATAYLDLIDDLAAQKAYMMLLSAFADQAWQEFIGYPVWMIPAAVEDANANEIKKHITHWLAEGYKRLIKTDPTPAPKEATPNEEPAEERANRPTVFISYSWDSREHKGWVLEFGKRLAREGIKVVMDQTDLRLGARFPEFMERSVLESQRVLVVCTEAYKQRFDAREGGAGYEGNIITGEMVTQEGTNKFIPILRQGDWRTAVPTALSGIHGVDLREDATEEYERLLLDLITFL